MGCNSGKPHSWHPRCASCCDTNRREGPLGMRDGKVLASGALAHALSEQLASNQVADAPVHVGVSFLSRNGDYCRTFMLREKSTIAGLACRDGGGLASRGT